MEERMAGAKGKAFVQGLNQEEHCSYAIGVNHYPILNINLLNNTERNRSRIIFSFYNVNSNRR